MTQPFFTILTAVLNRRDYIDRMLESVAAQTTSNFEIVIADNGSDDGTYEHVCSLRRDNLVVVRQPERGKAFALNEGLKVARGKWILILDSDNRLIAPGITGELESRILGHSDMDCFLTRNVGLSGTPISHPVATGRALTISEFEGQSGEFAVIYKTDFIRHSGFPEVPGCRTEFPAVPVLAAAAAGRLCTLDVVAQIYDTTPTDRISNVVLTRQVMLELYHNYRMTLAAQGAAMKAADTLVWLKHSLKYGVYGRLTDSLSLAEYRASNAHPAGLLIWAAPRPLLQVLLAKVRERTEAART